MADAASDAFLILHGFENHRPEGHWQHWLHGELVRRGFATRYPQLPDPDAPTLSEWRRALRAELARSAGRRLTVVAHSLSCLLWLHAVAADGVSAERVLLVAPPTEAVVTTIEAIREFAWVPARSADPSPSLLVASDADPYLPRGVEVEWARPLGVPFAIVPGAGHLTPADGYGAWPAVLEWCLTGAGFAAGTVGETRAE